MAWWVTHESIRHWCKRFGAEFAKRLRRRRPRPGDTLHFDEVFIRIGGLLHYLWRAVDQHGVVLDILAQEKRDGAAAKRFFRRLLKGLRYKPKSLITDGLRSYGVARRALLPEVKHRTSQYLNKSGRELAPANAAAGATDATVQVIRPGAGFPLGAHHHLRTLPVTAASDQRQWFSACTGKGVSDLATGDVCPAVGVTPGMSTSPAPSRSVIR